MQATYSIIRFYKDDRPRKIMETGLTLAEAQNHCNSKDTEGEDFFDGFEKE